MAKRKKQSRGRSRGRGMGSISTRGGSYQSLLMLAGGAIVGGAVAQYGSNMIGDKLPPKGKAVGQIALGAVIAQQSKHPFVQGVGIGLITAGGTVLLKSTGMLSGTDEAYYSEGYDDYMGAAGGSDDDSGPLDMMSGGDDEIFD